MLKLLFYELPFKSNFIKTLYFNFRVFPFSVAMKFPVRVIGRAKLIGLRKGCVELKHDDTPSFSIQLGVVAFDSTLTTQLKFSRGATLAVGKNVRIHGGANISVNENAKLTLGDDVLFNHNVFLACSNEMTIGNHVRFGWNVQVTDSDFHVLYDSEKKEFLAPWGTVKIGDYVWIGNHSSISKRSVVPSHSIVSSYSLVNKDLSGAGESGCLFAGIPAKCKKSGIHRMFDASLDKHIQGMFNGSPSLPFDALDEETKKKFQELHYQY